MWMLYSVPAGCFELNSLETGLLALGKLTKKKKKIVWRQSCHRMLDTAYRIDFRLGRSVRLTCIDAHEITMADWMQRTSFEHIHPHRYSLLAKCGAIHSRPWECCYLCAEPGTYIDETMQIFSQRNRKQSCDNIQLMSMNCSEQLPQKYCNNVWLNINSPMQYNLFIEDFSTLFFVQVYPTMIWCWCYCIFVMSHESFLVILLKCAIPL